MRIAFDARMLTYTGIGSYVRGVLQAGAKQDSGDEWIILGDPVQIRACTGNPAHFRVQPLRPRVYSWPDQILVPWVLRQVQADVFHTPHFVVPWAYRGPLVVTLHDLIYSLFPEELPSRGKKWLYRWLIQTAVQRATQIMVDSACTQQDVERLLHVPTARITVVPLGIEPRFKPVTDRVLQEAVCRRYDIELPFILYVGLQKPHKNVTGLVRIFARAQRRLPQPYQLVLVGPPGLETRAVMQEALCQGIAQAVRVIGYVDPIRAPDDLPTLYSAATAFVTASLYEGFGLPPVEAMACGTPVVASNRASLPEVLGDAALLVDPENEEEFAEALVRVLTDPDLQAYLSHKGRKRAAGYTWERTMEIVRRVYRQAAGKEIRSS